MDEGMSKPGEKTRQGHRLTRIGADEEFGSANIGSLHADANSAAQEIGSLHADANSAARSSWCKSEDRLGTNLGEGLSKAGV